MLKEPSISLFIVAEFAQKISIAHEQFANQVQSVVDVFKKRNQELKNDRQVNLTLNTTCDAYLNMYSVLFVTSSAPFGITKLIFGVMHVCVCVAG